MPVYDAGEHEGALYLAMRFVPGIDLQRLVARQGPLGPERAVALIAQLANGVDVIHAAGLVHRDLKPANVLLSEARSEAYVTDFGLAKSEAATTDLTAAGKVIGTPDYISPEQVEGKPVDARADVYALGCVLFFELTGEPHYPREEPQAKLFAHVNADPPAISERGEDRLWPSKAC